MKLKNGFGEERIYLNPSPDEIAELSTEKWDTLRIVVYGDDFLVASGFGHTHETIAKAYRRHMIGKRILVGYGYNLYHEDGEAYFNLEDESGNERATYSEWRNYFEDGHEAIIKDLIRERGLALV